MYAVTMFFFLLFQYLQNYTFFLRQPRLFKLYQALFIWKKLATDDDAYLGWDWSKILLFCIEELIFLY